MCELNKVVEIYFRIKYRKDISIDLDWNLTKYNRISVLNLLINTFNLNNYLEIGCDKDLAFNSIFLDNKIGVDPIRGGNVRSTSDDFFASNKKKFDLIFIDGLHEYTQARRDLVNSLAHSTDEAWIIFHDMFPRNAIEELTPCRTSGPWTGNVWKIAFDLLDVDGIDFKLVLIDHGVLVIHKLKHDIKVSLISPEASKLNFTNFFRDRDYLPMINWSDFKIWVTSGKN